MSKILRRCLSLVLAFMLLASLSVVGAPIVSADNKTGDGLAAYAMQAYNEGWQYVWGGASPGAVDCSGLIYSYVGGGARVTEDMLYSSPESGNVSDGVPDIPGLGLWQPGHVGVYVGGGMAVDARDEISNVCYQSVSEKSWVMWFKVDGVSYGESTGTTKTDQSEKTTDTSYSVSTQDSDEDEPYQQQYMQLGSTGGVVNALQQRLKDLGYFEDDTTEYFGYVTQGALMEFQTAAGLSATGICDNATLAALQDVNAPIKPADKDSDITEEDSTETLTSNADEDDSDEEITIPEIREDEETEPDEQVTAQGEKTAENSDEEKPQSVPEEADDDSENAAAVQHEESTDSEQSSASGSDKDISEGDYPDDVLYTKGDVDSEISDIQYVLIKLGYFDNNITGVYCDDTAAAVEKFRSDFKLGQGGDYLDFETVSIIYAVYDGSYVKTEQLEGVSPLGVQAESEQTDSQTNDGSDDKEEVQPEAGENEQSVTVTLGGSESEESAQTNEETETENAATESEITSQPEEAAQTDSDKVDTDTENGAAAQTSISSDTDSTTTTGAASSTATTAASSTQSSSRSPKTSDNTAVVFVETGVEEYVTLTNILIAIGISLGVIFFAGTVHYWNVSMEKRKQRAKRATTVAVYHRSLM